MWVCPDKNRADPGAQGSLGRPSFSGGGEPHDLLMGPLATSQSSYLEVPSNTSCLAGIRSKRRRCPRLHSGSAPQQGCSSGM